MSTIKHLGFLTTSQIPKSSAGRKIHKEYSTTKSHHGIKYDIYEVWEEVESTSIPLVTLEALNKLIKYREYVLLSDFEGLCF